ncbi:hypothetical protein [Streptacidiphilus neutrinimicus]|uniref:hypothetical protein n=1 Tax=Streptacidiphilus neutrinimicus TaxID=105420 RepID=UPI0006941457|nr:hypothetical protein [Streptacidiphilus neutrinimicus]
MDGRQTGDASESGGSDAPSGQGSQAGLSMQLVASAVEQLEELMHSVDELKRAAGLSLGRAEELRRMLSDSVRSSAGTLPVPWGEELVGFSTIGPAIDRQVAKTRIEMLTAQPDGARRVETLAEALASVEPRLKAGVKMRTLYQHTARFDEATKAYARAAIDMGAEIRTLDEFFDRLLIFDRKVAFLPMNSDRSGALRITHPALVHFLADSFDRAWDRASDYPFQPSHATEAAAAVMPNMVSAIKKLMVRGYPDAAIARRLGISSRSLQAHIQRIKIGMGASNRLQLGYQLALQDLRNGGGDSDLLSGDDDFPLDLD